MKRSAQHQSPYWRITSISFLAVVWMLGLAVALSGQTVGEVKAPAHLQATSANRTEIKLAWTSSDATTTFRVERHGAKGAWTTLKDITGATCEDDHIEPSVTYQYRVRAVGHSRDGGGAFVSDPSNVITVGPPPDGFSQVAAAPQNISDPHRFGQQVSMALDANGDPAVAYLFIEPRGNFDDNDNAIYFVGWDRATHRWKAPVKVDTVGLIDRKGSLSEISLAYDASTDIFGVAYEAGQSEIDISLSRDGGKTWHFQKVSTITRNIVEEPSLAMAGGQVFMAYYEEHLGIRFFNGNENEPPARWNSRLLLSVEGTTLPRPEGISVALDSAHRPGVAYWLDSRPGVTLAFWKGGAFDAVKVTDTKHMRNDNVDARLAFSGLNPIIAFYAARDEAFYNLSHEVWVVQSTDGGRTWREPTPLPNDGDAGMRFPLAIAAAPGGETAVAATVHGGNSRGARCGQPKVMRSPDMMHWSVCSPGGVLAPTADASYPALAFGGNGTLYVAFQNASTNFKLSPGIVLWVGP